MHCFQGDKRHGGAAGQKGGGGRGGGWVGINGWVEARTDCIGASNETVTLQLPNAFADILKSLCALAEPSAMQHHSGRYAVL